MEGSLSTFGMKIGGSTLVAATFATMVFGLKVRDLLTRFHKLTAIFHDPDFK